MVSEYDNKMRQAHDLYSDLYKLLLNPTEESKEALDSTVVLLQKSCKELVSISSSSDDVIALSEFSELAESFFDIFIVFMGGKNEQKKIKISLDGLMGRFKRISGDAKTKWLTQPASELQKDIHTKVGDLISKVLTELRLKVLYQNELELINLLNEISSFESVKDREAELIELIKDYKNSIVFSEVQVADTAKELETQFQIDRVERLLSQSPDSPELLALRKKAKTEYSRVRERIAKKIDKARELMEVAKQNGNWSGVNDQANIILGYQHDNLSAKAAKAEAKSRQKDIDGVKEKETVVLKMISDGNIDQAYAQLQKSLQRISNINDTDSKLKELLDLGESLVSFQVQWKDLIQYIEQNDFSLAISKARRLLNDLESPLPQPLRELLEKKSNDWQIAEKGFREDENSERLNLANLRAEFKRAKGWTSLYELRHKVLELSKKVKGTQNTADLGKFLTQLESALDQTLAGEVDAMVAKTVQTFQSTTRTLTALTDFLGNGKATTDNSGIETVRRFLTGAGRQRHQAIIEKMQKSLESYHATSNDWLEQAQRALEEGRLSQAIRYAEKAGKIGKDRNSQKIIREAQSQLDILMHIRQVASINNIANARKELADFVAKHEQHEDAKRLERELDFGTVDGAWEKALANRDAEKQKELVNTALLLTSNAELRKLWQDRKVEVLNRQDDFTNAQHLLLDGKLGRAVSLLEKIKKFDKRADGQIDEINRLLLQIEEASQAVKDEKYDLALRLFKDVGEKIHLPETYENELRKAYFEFHQKEAQDSLQMYNLAETVRNFEEALRYSPNQGSKAIRKNLEKYRSLWFEIQDWEKKVRSLLDQGADLEVKGSLDAAKGRYGDAFAISPSPEADELIKKIYPALRTELIDSVERVDKLIELKEKINEFDDENTDPENRLKIYNQYLELSIAIVPAYKELAAKLEESLKERRSFRSEFEVIRTKLESGDIDQLAQAFLRIAELEKLIVKIGDAYLDNEFSKLSREAHATQAVFKEYKGLIDEAQRLIKESQYQPAQAVLRRAEAVWKTPQVEGLKNQVANSIERQMVVSDQFKLVENRMQEGDWRGANEILIQIAAIGPSEPSQIAQLESLRLRVSEEIEKSDALKRHFEVMRGLLNNFDYQEADKQLSIARERFGNRLEFIELEREIEQVRQDCVRLKDLLERANEAFARNRLRESEALYTDAMLIPNADEMIRIKGWQTLRGAVGRTSNSQQSGGIADIFKKFFGN